MSDIDGAGFITGVLVTASFTVFTSPGRKALLKLEDVVRVHIMRLQQSTRDFFFGTESGTRRYRDPLMDIVAENPVITIGFIKHVMVLAVFSAALSSFPTLYYLYKQWSVCSVCDRPLRSWALANALISLLQLPLRLLFVLRLQYLKSRNVASMTAGFHQLTSSYAWLLSKAISLANYGWFILGVIWTFTSSHCQGLNHLCLLVITLTLVRIFITLGSFYYYFPMPAARRRNEFFTLRVTGLAKAKFDLLPTPIPACKLGTREDDICSICISGYSDVDLCRRLPTCSHYYHVRCIDQWLSTSGTCPLCQRIVDPR